jgi:hypothetical protein
MQLYVVQADEVEHGADGADAEFEKFFENAKLSVA